MSHSMQRLCGVLCCALASIAFSAASAQERTTPPTPPAAPDSPEPAAPPAPPRGPEQTGPTAPPGRPEPPGTPAGPERPAPPRPPTTREAPEATATTPPAANPADVESIDAIVKALYDVISGPAGERDWNRFRSLFAPGARLIPAVPGPEGGASAVVMDVEGYIRRAGEYFKKEGFYEREIARRTDTFGNIADLFSVYESRKAPTDPEPFQRGINSIQLLRNGDRWWVVTIFWDAERPDNPIPEAYLPTRD